MNIKKRRNEKGQALLFVVVAVTIALSVGVSVATRTLSSQKRVSSSDTATRVTGAAEGGAEWALGQTYTLLSSLTSGTVVSYSPTSGSGDNITAKATVSAKTFKTNASDNYWFDLSPGMVKEVRLAGYFGGITVCWENKEAAIYTLSYNPLGVIKRQWFRPSSGFPNLSKTKGFTPVNDAGHSALGYAACTQTKISLVSSVYGLRIRSLYAATRIHVYPSSLSNFPDQGYKITSIGELVSGGTTNVKETRIVVVYKSYPYAASFIDAGLYSANGPID